MTPPLISGGSSIFLSSMLPVSYLEVNLRLFGGGPPMVRGWRLEAVAGSFPAFKYGLRIAVVTPRSSPRLFCSRIRSVSYTEP